MPRYAAFLRAVNVGGRWVKMAALRDVLVDVGLADVATYIQSGNAVVTSPLRSAGKVEALFEEALREAFGFEVVTMVRTKPELASAVAAGRGLTDAGRHMISICKTAPEPAAVDALHAWALQGERATVIGREIHAFYDKPFNEAKLATKVEKLARTPATTREFRVAEAVLELL